MYAKYKCCLHIYLYCEFINFCQTNVIEDAVHIKKLYSHGWRGELGGIRVLISLLEGLCSVSSTHVRLLINAYNSNLWDSVPLFWAQKALH